MSGNSRNMGQMKRDPELVDSVMGSAKACTNISENLDYLKQTTAGCLSEPLGLLETEFFRMGLSYTLVGDCMRKPKPIWNQNITLSIKFTRDQCQQIAEETSAILKEHGPWTVRATSGSCYRLNVLAKRMGLYSMYNELFTRTLKLVEPPEEPARHGLPVCCPDSTSSHYARQERAAASARQRMKKGVCSSSFTEVEQALEWTKKCSKALRDIQITEASPQRSDISEHSIMDDWSTTQSTTGIMTPSEDWSDLGSDTTEIGHAPAITRHSLQLCGYATANFLRLINELQSPLTHRNDSVGVGAEDLQRLHKAYDELVVLLLHALDAPVPSELHLSYFSNPHQVVNYHNLSHAVKVTGNFLHDNNDIEESFGHLPGSTPVGRADIEAMHKAYGYLVDTLLLNLAAPIPFQNERFAPRSTPAPVAALALAQVPAPFSIPAQEVPRAVVHDV
ncbi:hypothetical protein M436DRAFT_60358 [Aureobasidium namibiae CBS 147.97]|uniref:Uncharacterized protein n=1 Tax=Aureobasidium namibiae CBS 147.97 TaxID=1043004 RepID=A0A074WTQ7_9PEZI